MTFGPTNLYWDSCVFMRYLTQDPEDFVNDIQDFIADAKKGDRKIFFSSIVFVEIRQWALKSNGYAGIREFFNDLGASFFPVNPDPNIMMAAGELRGSPTVNPDPKADKTRVLGTPDAIHLMTCVHIRDVYGVSDIVFHTLDKGRGTNWEGKCVPLLGFERWYPEGSRTKSVDLVCGLTRSEPKYPQHRLFSEKVSGQSIVSQQRH